MLEKYLLVIFRSNEQNSTCILLGGTMLQIENLIMISDLHSGDQLGLCPAKGIALDEGGWYKPNSIQLKMAEMWEHFWYQWVPKVTRGEPYAVAVVGDAIEGRHHRATHQITPNLATHKKVAYELLSPVRDACDGNFYLLRGTEAHVGPSGEDEETLAKELDAIPNEFGQYARYELWKQVGDGLVHLMHHIGTTSSAAYEATAVHKELIEEFTEAARWGEKAPNVVVRAHRHRFLEVRIATEEVYGVSLVLPGWQAKTPFAYKVAGARIALPQFGGVLVKQGDEELYTRSKVWNLKRQSVE